MPDGSPITLHNAFLYFEDGSPVRVTEMQEIDITTTDMPDEDARYTFNPFQPTEVTMHFTMSNRAKRRLWNLAAYGWRAKGHLRKKALQKALRMREKEG